jgi:tetratricopeptide (TPR) repeat protein
VTYDEILRLLPPLEEFEELRLALAGVAEFDPAGEWEKSRSYSTVDQRVLDAGKLSRTVEEVEKSLHLHLRELFTALPALFESYAGGEVGAAATQLIELGERFEGRGRLADAGKCFAAALSLSLPLTEKEPQILALRRLGRVALARGELPEAVGYYERSAQLARDASNLPGEVIARTGEGNVRVFQGLLHDAEKCYREAHLLTERENGGAELVLERGQLYNNLGMVSARQGRFEEAESWFSRAGDHWAATDSPLDTAAWKGNLGQLRVLQGRHAEAREILEQALELEIPHWVRAEIAIELAECLLAQGDLAEARRWGRIAEQHALAARSPAHLASLYRGLGNIAREAGEEDGFIFYEKALQLARLHGFPLLEGEALLDYAAHRNAMGEGDEARAYLERAIEILGETGAEHALERARSALRSLEGNADRDRAAV